MNNPPDALDALVGRQVVLDVTSLYVYVGTLAGYDRRYVILDNADVHDLRDTNTSRERYVLESKTHGVRINRERVYVRWDEVVSVSPLEDVVE